MNKKTTVTIGIPVYNEEANIGTILDAILAQEETDFVMDKIFVISDESIDRTHEIVQSFIKRDKRLQLIINEKRNGQISAQNKIFSLANTDIVVLFEADTVPEGTKYLHELIRPIVTNPKIGLVQGNTQPLPSHSIVGRILDRQVHAHYSFMVRTPAIVEWFTSGRGGRAFTKTVYKQLVWPPSVPEDVYAFLWCKKNNIETVFRRSAVCRYKIPQKFADLVKERQKIRSGEITMVHYFPKEHLDRIYHKPLWFIIKPAIYFLIKNKSQV